MVTLSATDRVTLRRHPERAATDVGELQALLDEVSVVHVAVGGRVLPMALGRLGQEIFLHGSRANALLSAALVEGATTCVAATVVDGLVLARSAFHHSMNFRCAVIYGQARRIEGERAHRALEAILEHRLPGRARECRPPSAAERAATLVVAIDLSEASVKIRRGGPKDKPDDEALPHWAGVLPLVEGALAAQPSAAQPSATQPSATQPPAAQPSAAVPVPPSLVRAALDRAPPLPGEAAHGSLTLSGDPRRLDLPRLLGWLKATYWADDLDADRLLRSIQRSFVAGAYTAGGEQVAFARAVTDAETLGWLADVYVEPSWRGRGVGRALCRWLVDHPDLARLRRWILGTADAHRLYRGLGFEPLPPERYMVRRRV